MRKIYFGKMMRSMSQNELGTIIPPAGLVSLPINEALPPALTGRGRKKVRKNKKKKKKY